MRVEDSLKNVVQLGVLELQDLRWPTDNGDALWAAITAHGERLHATYGGLSAGQVPGVEDARRLYRSVGIDPTKHRPSSEALLRRLIKDKSLYRVHPLVDLFNLASLAALLPVGLYDLRRIEGDEVVVRLGAPSWGFDGIRKDRVHVEGRLCIADAMGPFGSPTSDSLRTSIEGEVSAALAVFYAPTGGEPGRLEGALDHAAALARQHMDATVLTSSTL